METNVSEEPVTYIILEKKSSILMKDAASSRGKLLSTTAYVVTLK
jgi:hypothetical protein